MPYSAQPKGKTLSDSKREIESQLSDPRKRNEAQRVRNEKVRVRRVSHSPEELARRREARRQEIIRKGIEYSEKQQALKNHLKASREKAVRTKGAIPGKRGTYVEDILQTCRYERLNFDPDAVSSNGGKIFHVLSPKLREMARENPEPTTEIDLTVKQLLEGKGNVDISGSPYIRYGEGEWPGVDGAPKGGEKSIAPGDGWNSWSGGGEVESRARSARDGS